MSPSTTTGLIYVKIIYFSRSSDVSWLCRVCTEFHEDFGDKSTFDEDLDEDKIAVVCMVSDNIKPGLNSKDGSCLRWTSLE